MLMALRLNLQPQGNVSFGKPEENNSNSVISYQSRLSLQPANHESVALRLYRSKVDEWLSLCAKMHER